MLSVDNQVSLLALGVVYAQGLSVGPSGAELRAACDAAAERARRDGLGGGEPRREAVRALLRAGGFRPAGRSKPAQEYLLRTVQETGGLPSILNAVDWINAVSLEAGLPISLLAAARCGVRVVVRLGQPGERYVFNLSGQELALEGLIVVCRAQDGGVQPLGTPVKDSLEGKIAPPDEDVLAFLFAPRSVITPAEMQSLADRLAAGFFRWCGARNVRAWLEPAAWSGPASEGKDAG